MKNPECAQDHCCSHLFPAAIKKNDHFIMSCVTEQAAFTVFSTSVKSFNMTVLHAKG